MGLGFLKIIACCYLSHFQSESQVRKRIMEPETGLFPFLAEDMDSISKEALPQLLQRGNKIVGSNEDHSSCTPSTLSNLQ